MLIFLLAPVFWLNALAFRYVTILTSVRREQRLDLMLTHMPPSEASVTPGIEMSVRPLNRLHACTLVVALITLPFLSGCGGTLVAEGNVTFDGEPVTEGSISFEAPDGASPTFGGRIENGEYRITGIPPTAAGPRIVRITASRKTGKKIPAGPPTPPGTMVDEIRPVPSRYNRNSKEQVNLQKGVSNRFDFALRSDPPRLK